MVRHFQNVLQKFPASRLRPDAVARVRAVDLAEPPLFERQIAALTGLDELLEDARWFLKADCAFEVETYWDLWQFEEDWKILPAPVSILCHGPLFPSELGEQIRIEFGLDSQFLPQPELSANFAPVRHNIRSLLHLVGDLDEVVPSEKKLLWSESGVNFVERLQAALSNA